MRRPRESVVMQIHEPSPAAAERSSSALKPGSTFKDSAGVANSDFSFVATGFCFAARAANGTSRSGRKRIREAKVSSLMLLRQPTGVLSRVVIGSEGGQAICVLFVTPGCIDTLPPDRSRTGGRDAHRHTG